MESEIREPKRYLGDSVYGEFDGYGIWITTENGFGPSNRIYIEPSVGEEFSRFMEMCFKREGED